ncbi:MAG: hypothetical protein H6838_06730 [Planctomycetes bacterium]|nr:hypothetical protein [Planctomycetota bacterium]MCB9885170.1 hypothetical protein [Planctomycetota bacterium]
MTQLDLPQISLQRYVELLKRRRWQVVPASLLGLLLGGLIAFFIPRYYVANTQLWHEMAPGQSVRSKEDPFRSIVESAKLTLPLAVDETVETLGWPEAMVTDPFVRSENVRAIRDRLSINDSNQRPDRDYAQISVTYKDLDGDRCAALLNTLVTTWIDQRLAQYRQQAEQERGYAAEAFAQADKAYEELLDSKRYLEQEYGLDPQTDALGQRQLQRERAAAHKALVDRLAQRRIDVATAEKQLAKLRNELDLTDKRRPITPGAPVGGTDLEKTVRAVITLKQFDLVRQRETMRNFQDWTPSYKNAEKRIAELEAELALLGVTGDAADGTEPNPRYAELEQEIRKLEGELLAMQTECEMLEKRVAEDAARLVRQAEGYALYQKRLSSLEDVKKKRDESSETLAAKDAALGQLQNKRTIRQLGKANPPPRPTDPNILIVALIGCVLGLGFAIGLILLLDVLQGSYKTIDEVERGLAVPVLGGMSHLETVEQQERTQRGRRRVTLFAAAFLCLCVVVVTVFYVDPTRLPSSVRDLLAMLLGD